MSLREEIPDIVAFVKANAAKVKYNEKLLCIYEGEILPLIEEHLAREFSKQSLEAVLPRIPPINIFRRLVDKMSKIYQQSPQRKVVNGSAQDDDLLDWYVERFKMDRKWNTGNEYYNTFKNCLMQPYVDPESGPKLRAVPSDRFLPYSTNKFDPTSPTHMVLFQGSMTKVTKNDKGKDNIRSVDIYWVYSFEEFLVVDSEAEVRYDLMQGMEQYHELGALPFEYVNKSENFLIPPEDSDSLRMSILIPVLMADLNYAVKFQAFSIIYGIDLDDENLTLSPNVFWRFRSDPTTDKTPEVGSIKPTIDITEVVNLIVTELGLWLNSKGIRPGAVSQVAAENFSSGISKMIDEMDTAEARQSQVTVFKDSEESFWDTVMHKLHPEWVDMGIVENTHKFSPGAKVEVNFPLQLPFVDRKAAVEVAIQEINNGLLSIEEAMRRLNPEWSEDRLTEELKAIEEGSVIEVSDGESVDIQMPDQGGAPVEDAAKTALNGAQVQSMVEVTQQVASGIIPKASAIAMVMTSFNISRDEAAAIIDPIEVKPPEEVATVK